METTCQDAVFGTMTYKYGWLKSGTVSLFGKEWPISVDAAAYSGENFFDYDAPQKLLTFFKAIFPT